MFQEQRSADAKPTNKTASRKRATKKKAQRKKR
jgi:hypothetical protein